LEVRPLDEVSSSEMRVAEEGSLEMSHEEVGSFSMRAVKEATVTADGYLKFMAARLPRIPPELSASARIYQPDPASSRYAVAMI
jgi:hypothetical protein